MSLALEAIRRRRRQLGPRALEMGARDGVVCETVRRVRQAARCGRSCWLKPSHVGAIASGRAPGDWYTRGDGLLWWRLNHAWSEGIGCRLSADSARDLLDREDETC